MLTDTALKNMKPKEKAYKIADRDGMYAEVKTTGRIVFRFEIYGALWPAHNFFYWMLVHPTRPIDLGCPCCGRVSDDEALILAALFAPLPAASRAALAELVAPLALNGAVRLAKGFGAELATGRFDHQHKPAA
jgi:hypothetical protein